MDVIRLDNGLRCIFEKRKDTGVVAVQVWVNVGSRYEDDRIAGITHFIEHLIFKGTEKGEGYEIAPKIEAMGGSINAWTSYDNTVYHIVVPKKSLETGMQLLIDSVTSPAFPEKELEKEKKVVIEEIKMGEDDPDRKLFKELFSASYPRHPYGRPIIGYAESVAAVTRADIVSYFKKHYSPENLSVVVVGDFEEDKVRQIIQERLGDLKGGKGPRGSGAYAGSDDKRKIRILERNVKESYLMASYPIHNFTHPDTPALDVLSTILADGDSSRLLASLKHKQGLITNGDTYVFVPQENGVFTIRVTFKGTDHERVMKGVDEELDRITKDGIESWELEKARNLVEASYVYGAETVQGKARLVGNFETLTGDPFYAEKYLKAVEKVTADDVKRVAKTYLQPKKRSVALLLPKAADVLKAAPNPYSFDLPNGLKCIYNRNASSPSLAFMIGFVGGLKEEQPGQNGSFNILSKMLLKGTKDLDAQAIARKIDTLAGSIGPVAGRNVFGLSGKFLSKDFGEGLGLLKKLLMETVIGEEGLKRVKEEVLSQIRQRDDDPAQYTFTKMNALLYEGHPYARDLIGTAAEVTGLTRDQVEKLYRSYVSPKGAILALSGDVEQEKAEALIRALFSDWKGGEHALRKITYALPATRERTVEKDNLQTHMIFAFVGPGVIDADRYPVEVMNAILSGMGGRIHRKLREENPYAYAVTFFNQQAYELGTLGIYIGTDRARVKDVERIARAEIEAIRKEGFTEEEVVNAKRYMIGNHYIRMQTNGSIASSMCLDTIYGLKPDFFKVWPEEAEKVTREQVNEAARKYLLLDRMVRIEVGPASK